MIGGDISAARPTTAGMSKTAALLSTAKLPPPGRHRAIWMGEDKAPDERAAIEKPAAEFKVIASKLIAMRRG